MNQDSSCDTAQNSRRYPVQYSENKGLLAKITTVPGLSFKPKTKNRLKKGQNLLVKGRLITKTDIVVWHDLVMI